MVTKMSYYVSHFEVNKSTVAIESLHDLQHSLHKVHLRAIAKYDRIDKTIYVICLLSK